MVAKADSLHRVYHFIVVRKKLLRRSGKPKKTLGISVAKFVSTLLGIAVFSDGYCGALRIGER